jgi:hypothetical protein
VIISCTEAAAKGEGIPNGQMRLQKVGWHALQGHPYPCHGMGRSASPGVFERPQARRAKGGRRAGSEMFLFGVETADALPERWPPVPKVYAMLAEAEAVRGALEELLRNASGERALFVHFLTSRSTIRFLSASGASCPHREGEST